MNNIFKREKVTLLLGLIIVAVIAIMLAAGSGLKSDDDKQAMSRMTEEPVNTDKEMKENTGTEPVKETPEPDMVPTVSLLKPAPDCRYTVKNDYVNKKIHITFDNCAAGSYGAEFVTASGNGQAGFIKGIEIKEKKKITASITLSHVYEYEVSEDDKNIYLQMHRPRQLYDKIIVIDAGHGGKDDGCKSPDRKYKEKNLTLAVAKKLRKRFDNSDIKVYFTRLNDETVYLSQRVGLVNDVEADMFISIHCNAYEYYWAGKARGVETLYSSKVKGLKKANYHLAGLMLKEYVASTKLPAREIIDRKDDIVILKESKVPSTVLELGYMTDASDLKFLTDNKKMEKIVEGIYNGIIKYYESNE